jgi:hypothetical protein
MQADETINNGTDWTEVYCQLLSLHLNDPLFQAKNFSKLPIKLLADVLEKGYKAMQMRTNAASISTAKLAMVVMGALGGKGSRAKLDQFLPYELDDGTSTLRASTKEALEWALKNQKMPTVVVGMIGAELA